MEVASAATRAYRPFDHAPTERRLRRLRAIRKKADQEIATIEEAILNEIKDRRALLLKVDEDLAALERVASVMSGSIGKTSDIADHTDDGFGRHRTTSSNAILGWSPTRDVLSTAYRILSDKKDGMKRRELFRAVQSTGLTMPGTDAIKNFGTLMIRSELFRRGRGRYHAVRKQPHL